MRISKTVAKHINVGSLSKHTCSECFFCGLLCSQDDKKAGQGPLSQYAKIMRQRAKQRNESLVETE